MGSTFVGARLQVFYDADCGLCTHAARLLRRLDGRGRLELTPLQIASATTADTPPLDSLRETMHVLDTAGRWSVGGQAWIRISQEVPLLRPLGVLARLPLIRRFVESVYAYIAANRHRISRLLGLGVCRVDSGPTRPRASSPGPTSSPS